VIDWDVAVNTGIRLARPGPQVDLADARQAVAQLRELSVTAQGHVQEFTGMNLLEPAGPAVIVDRPGWIRANVDGFRVVLEPMLDRLGAQRIAAGAGTAGSITTAVGSRITGAQLGAVLSYLAGRVLGQYELFLPPDPDGNAPTGRLTLVAPNIVQAERELDVDPRDFRLWVCLHEETHRMQFSSSTWLRGHVQGLMQEMVLSSEMDAAAFLDRLRAAGEAVAEVVRGGEGSLLQVFQSDEQSEIMDRITAVMSLAEGHGDYVMDAVGPEVVPSVAEIRRRFQRRREGANRIDRIIRQLLGLDLKMKQYEEGAAFVRKVVAQVGMADFNRVWESPETLPTLAEIRDPDAWIARVVRPAALTAGAEDAAVKGGGAAPAADGAAPAADGAAPSADAAAPGADAAAPAAEDGAPASGGAPSAADGADAGAGGGAPPEDDAGGTGDAPPRGTAEGA